MKRKLIGHRLPRWVIQRLLLTRGGVLLVITAIVSVTFVTGTVMPIVTAVLISDERFYCSGMAKNSKIVAAAPSNAPCPQSCMFADDMDLYPDSTILRVTPSSLIVRMPDSGMNNMHVSCAPW